MNLKWTTNHNKLTCLCHNYAGELWRAVYVLITLSNLHVKKEQGQSLTQLVYRRAGQSPLAIWSE